MLDNIGQEVKQCVCPLLDHESLKEKNLRGRYREEREYKVMKPPRKQSKKQN